MTLRLTPDMLAAGYEFLRTTEPFKGLRLPEADEIGFHVIATPNYHADTIYDDKKPGKAIVVRVSGAKNGHSVTLLAALGHEMIHVHQALIEDSGNHNDLFKKLAARACRAHGFDPKTF